MIYKLFFLINFVLLGLYSVAQESEKQCYEQINCNDLKLIIETKDVLLVDVRLHKEYRKERIDNSFLASNSNALKDLLKDVEKTRVIAVYCEEGTRSEVAAQIICNDLNFKKVFNLQGGLISWKQRGYFVDKERIKNRD
jgi:rhodanese-related sulfurtransferase